MKSWKPANIGGSIHEDPRAELDERISLVEEHLDDAFIAIPLDLARALVSLHECDSTRVITGDEDGPLAKPIDVRCRKPASHRYQHSSGGVSWDKEGW